MKLLINNFRVVRDWNCHFFVIKLFFEQFFTNNSETLYFMEKICCNEAFNKKK